MDSFWVADWRKRKRHRPAALDAFAIKTSGSEADVSTLSGGNQQKVLVGRWLERRPRVLHGR
jgi:ABC-type sugar transport system ATPase subunit